jgi:signal transduction histidine kinase/DNA-binding response OmpR family regulator/serine phosphatase RsbU (regulator of sigma subunit)
VHSPEASRDEGGAPAVLRSSGEVGRDLLAVDWTATPLGDPATWPRTLTSVVRTMLGSRFSMWMAWGAELTFFCNDAYRRDTLAMKYPWALGRPARQVWAEIWDDIGPRIESVLATGQATWDEALMLFLERSGYREETYHTFSYSPLADDDDEVVGMLCVVAEETERVIAARRLATLNALSASLSAIHTEQDIGDAIATALGGNQRDLPFAITYLREDLPDGADSVRLASASGIAAGHPLAPRTFPLQSRSAPWPLADASTARRVVDIGGTIEDRATLAGAWEVPPARAVIVPLSAQTRTDAAGFLVAGLSPHRPDDEAYLGFVELLGGQIASAVASMRAYDAERLRAEQLTELDRAKTAFFMNISHEFRTPLTLMLGPLQDALGAGGEDRLTPPQEERVELAQRNGRRLLALVNTLLDFNRLQAGRLEPHLESVDLAAETAELASMFRSAVEDGGVELEVDCPPLGRRVDVDRRMWEQIVTNLVSNAFKFTLAGSISVRVRLDGEQVELAVADTGEGIAQADLPRVFDRFHRGSGARSRSIEGSGIGLALVRELVELQGGTVTIESRLGAGTTVRVRLPVAHRTPALPPSDPPPVRESAAARVAEAAGWVEVGGRRDAAPRVADATRARILVVDDNDDMRRYVERLLLPEYDVVPAASGAEAMAAIRELAPDVVVSDVMMPDVDGHELLRWIRTQPGLEELPVVLLSARAGSEAAVEGLDLGADDYLVKPFAAGELLGRVGARLASGRERRLRQRLGQLAAALAELDRPDAIVRTVQATLSAELGTANTTLALLGDDGATVRYHHAQRYGAGLDARWHLSPLAGDVPSRSAIRERRTLLVESRADLGDLEQLAGEWAAAGIHAAVATPLLRATGDAAGSLVAVWDAPRTITGDEQRFLERTAAVVVEALERLRSLQVEQRLVEELQERLLDVNLEAPVASIAVRYEPADAALLVGGDWYDVVTIGDGAIGISVGDVVGRGLPAAAVMSQLRSALGLAATRERDPCVVVDLVDRYALRVPSATGTTLVYAVVDDTGRLGWCSAGHLPPLVETAAGIRFLDSPQRRPLATRDQATGPGGSLELPPCALVLLYTDGLVERCGEVIDDGMARLADSVERHRDRPLAVLCDAVIAELRPDAGFRDDVALVALRMPGSTERRFVDVHPADGTELRPARARLRRWLAGLPVDETTRADVLLAIGEASANAMEHGSEGDRRRVVSVEVTLAEGTLTAAVSDSGRWMLESTGGPARGRGRGYAIMEALAREVIVHRAWVGSTVELRFAI